MDFFRPKVNFSDKTSTIFRAKSWKKLTFSLEKGVVNFYQLFEMAVFRYSTKFIEYRIPLFDFQRPRISIFFSSNGSSTKDSCTFRSFRLFKIPTQADKALHIGGHQKLFCRKAMLSFGSHQDPLHRGSRRVVHLGRSTCHAMNGRGW